MYEVVLELWDMSREVSCHVRDCLRVVDQRIGNWRWVSHAQEGMDDEEGKGEPRSECSISTVVGREVLVYIVAGPKAQCINNKHEGHMNGYVLRLECINA